MRTKAYRRFIERKFKNKSKRILKLIMNNFGDITKDMVGKYSHSHNRPCSCNVCSCCKTGNSSNRFDKQREISDIDFKEQLISI